MSTTRSSIQSPSAGLVKPKRTGIHKVHAASIKPPSVEPDPSGGDNHKYKCVYVTTGGKQQTEKCTYSVWKKCEGRNAPGLVPSGLDSKLKNDFFIVKDGDDVVVGVDLIPKDVYSTRAPMPEELQDKEDILVRVDQKDGSMEITQAPPGVSKNTLRRLLDALDNIEVVNTGDELPGGFEVLQVSGNMLSVLPPLKTV